MHKLDADNRKKKVNRARRDVTYTSEKEKIDKKYTFNFIII